MRNLMAARRINAGLIRIASTAPKDHPLHRVFVAWAKIASAQEDQFARLSYLEGALGYTPNSIVRKPMLHLDAARKAITSGDYESNPIARKLVIDLQVSPAEALRFVSANDQQIWSGLVYSSFSQMKPSGSIRGLSAEAIVNSIVFGISPITGNWMKYGQGKGMMYWLGENAPVGVTLAGVKSVATKEVANRTKDIVRGTTTEERTQTSLDQPAFMGGTSFEESPETVLEYLSSDDDSFLESLASSILRYDSTLKIIDPAVKAKLRTPTQKEVWEIIKLEPSLLILKPNGGVGVEARELAKMLASRTGQAYTGKTMDVVAAKVFNEAVLPAMFGAIRSDEAVKELAKSRDILQVMRQEIARRPKTENTRGVGIVSPPREPARWKQIPKGDPRRKNFLRQEKERLKALNETGLDSMRLAHSREALIKLASLMPKGSSDRRSLLKLALDLKSELAKDADPVSKDQNKPETYYGLPPRD